jgi:hypothetical protein
MVAVNGRRRNEIVQGTQTAGPDVTAAALSAVINCCLIPPSDACQLR